jgi:uncharacterized protein with beta-barrel porin domain
MCYYRSLNLMTTPTINHCHKLDAHRGASVKIHMSRSMASIINTSCSESLFRPQRRKINNILTTGDGTLAVGGGTQTVNCDTLMAGDGTLAVNGGTLTVDSGILTNGVGMLAVSGGTLMIDDSTLMVSYGTLMSDSKHRLSGAIASATW